MKTTVIFYGTSTGTCEDLAGRIGAKLGVDNVINVTDLDASVLADNENFILGTSTWGAGLQAVLGAAAGRRAIPRF